MRRLLLLALPPLSAGCVTLGLPVVPVAPTVRVKQFESRLITPTLIRFEARIMIRNRMRAPLEIQDVEWGVDVHGRPLFTETFTELYPMSSNSKQWITLPFQIATRDVLAEESLHIRFRGVVRADGFDPVPFEATRVIPIPRLPEVVLESVVGNPYDGELTVLLGVRNRNDYAMTFSRVDTFVDLDGRRYDLLRTDSQSHVGPGATWRLRLTMRHGRGKSTDVARDPAVDFTVGGSMACQTPYGTVLVPVELGPSSEARVQDNRRAGG